MDILFEKEILNHFGLPDIPSEKHKWDGVTSFKQGVAIVKLSYNDLAYAACTFDSEKEQEPRVVKIFTQEPFCGIEEIRVVPAFMDIDVENMDLDKESKRAAQMLAQEAIETREIQDDDDDSTESELSKLPDWVFDNIHNAEEAQAFIKNWNITNKVKGRVPTNEETLKLRLLTIYNEIQKKQK